MSASSSCLVARASAFAGEPDECGCLARCHTSAGSEAAAETSSVSCCQPGTIPLARPVRFRWVSRRHCSSEPSHHTTRSGVSAFPPPAATPLNRPLVGVSGFFGPGQARPISVLTEGHPGNGSRRIFLQDGRVTGEAWFDFMLGRGRRGFTGVGRRLSARVAGRAGQAPRSPPVGDLGSLSPPIRGGGGGPPVAVVACRWGGHHQASAGGVGHLECPARVWGRGPRGGGQQAPQPSQLHPSRVGGDGPRGPVIGA